MPRVVFDQSWIVFVGHPWIDLTPPPWYNYITGMIFPPVICALCKISRWNVLATSLGSLNTIGKIYSSVFCSFLCCVTLFEHLYFPIIYYWSIRTQRALDTIHFKCFNSTSCMYNLCNIFWNTFHVSSLLMAWNYL